MGTMPEVTRGEEVGFSKKKVVYCSQLFRGTYRLGVNALFSCLPNVVFYSLLTKGQWIPANCCCSYICGSNWLVISQVTETFKLVNRIYSLYQFIILLT